MPELPEVETLLRQLKRSMTGAVIREARVFDDRILNVPSKFLESGISGEKVTGFFRKGKYLGFETASGRRLWFHLGMTGRLLFASESKLPHTHLMLALKGSGGNLFFSDPRRFGRVIYLSPDEPPPEGLLKTGPDPFEMTEEQFVSAFHGRKGLMKPLLLNQRIVSGIGNIYADEGLFRAGLLPWKKAFRISRGRLGTLYRALREVLEEALAAGGSSIDDYRHVDGLKGSFQDRHRVYGRTGKPCRSCGGVIRVRPMAGRSSHYCPVCQK